MTLLQMKAEENVLFEYAGDDPNKSRVVSWFQMQLRAIGTCVDARLPEAALALVYSGIDTFGLLAAPPDVLDASNDTFKEWCEKYILPRVESVEGEPLTALDLWAARCGVLHNSTPLSKLERDGKARQIWYQFDGRTGINIILNAHVRPLILDILILGMAFKEGGIACITHINADAVAFQAADARAQHFLRWGRLKRRQPKQSPKSNSQA
jgi:hypothetical protein